MGRENRINRIAVSNFLASLQGLSYQEAVANCELDARAYGWNFATTAMIREGLCRHYFPQRKTSGEIAGSALMAVRP